MKITLSTNEAATRLRERDMDAWSGKGAVALIEYLEELERDTGTEIELDVIGLCCEYDEYPSALEYLEDIGIEDYDDEDAAIEYLEEHTDVIKFDGGIVIRAF